MIQRDQQIKEKPERFSTTFDQKKRFEVIFTYQKPILDKIIGEFHTNGNITFQLCHVINIETLDDPQHAWESAGTTLDLAKAISELSNTTDQIEAKLNEIAEDDNLPITYHIVSY
jgi:hypothetical protein